MDAKLLKVLDSIGLTRKEAQVYLAALSLGEGTVQEIAKKSSLKRTTLYPILEALAARRIVIETKSKKKTYYVPTDPAELLERAKSRVEEFTKNLDALNQIRKEYSKKPRIHLLSGVEGFKRIWDDIFHSGVQEYLIITDPREMLTFVAKGYITGKVIKEKIRRNIKSRQLVAFSEYAKEIVAKDKSENRVSKVLPHVYKIPYTTIVYGDKVAFISPAYEDVIFIVESETFAKHQRSLFEFMWEQL